MSTRKARHLGRILALEERQTRGQSSIDLVKPENPCISKHFENTKQFRSKSHEISQNPDNSQNLRKILKFRHPIALKLLPLAHPDGPTTQVPLG